LRAAHGLLKHERGEDVKAPTEGWYTGFVKRHKLKKKTCNIVEASRLTWATAENMQRWYLDNTLPFLLEKKLYTAHPEWHESLECTVPAAFVNLEVVFRNCHIHAFTLKSQAIAFLTMAS